jgi:hypothetical protein
MLTPTIDVTDRFISVFLNALDIHIFVKRRKTWTVNEAVLYNKISAVEVSVNQTEAPFSSF